MYEYKDASDRLTIEFLKISAKEYVQITDVVVTKFTLTAIDERVLGLDVICQSFQCGENIIGLEWDNWSGYIVQAKTKSAEVLVRNIAKYIHANWRSQTER